MRIKPACAGGPKAGSQPAVVAARGADMSLDGKTIIVTGVSSGIGAATANATAAMGARVIGIDRVAPDPSNSLTGFHLGELSDPASIDRVVGSLDGQIHGLANVAGVSSAAPYELQFKVNYFGTRYLTERLKPLFGPTVAVVSVASGTAVMWRERVGLFKELAATNGFEEGMRWLERNPQIGLHSYGRTKEALVVWTQLMARQAAGSGVRYNTVSPGPVATPMLQQFRDTIGEAIIEADIARSSRAGSVEEIAAVIAFMLSDAASWINGADLPVDGGFAASALLDNAKWPPDPA